MPNGRNDGCLTQIVNFYRIKLRIEKWKSSYTNNKQYEVKISRVHIKQTQIAQIFDEQRTTTNMLVLLQARRPMA